MLNRNKINVIIHLIPTPITLKNKIKKKQFKKKKRKIYNTYKPKQFLTARFLIKIKVNNLQKKIQRNVIT